MGGLLLSISFGRALSDASPLDDRPAASCAAVEGRRRGGFMSAGASSRSARGGPSRSGSMSEPACRCRIRWSGAPACPARQRTIARRPQARRSPPRRPCARRSAPRPRPSGPSSRRRSRSHASPRRVAWSSGRRSEVPQSRCTAGHVGEQQQLIGLEPLGEQRGGEVLVDHGLRLREAPVVARHDRHATAAGADHQHAALRQGAGSRRARRGRRGSGDATTRRMCVAVRRARSSRARSRGARPHSRVVDRSDRLASAASKAGSARVDGYIGEQGRDGAVRRAGCAAPPRAGSRSCLRSRPRARRADRGRRPDRRALWSARRPDLRTVAVGQHQLGARPRGRRAPLRRRRCCGAAFQPRAARRDEAARCLRVLRRSSWRATIQRCVPPCSRSQTS